MTRAASRHTRETGALSSDLHPATAMVLLRAIAQPPRALGNLDNECSPLVKSAFDTPTCTARLGPPAIPSRARSTPALLHTHGQPPRCSHVRVGPTDTAEGGLGEKRLGSGRQYGEPTTGRAQTSFSPISISVALLIVAYSYIPRVHAHPGFLVPFLSITIAYGLQFRPALIASITLGVQCE